ncbi:hypothetical protein MTO96_016426 [Rhipicephalus appendiculatus]
MKTVSAVPVSPVKVDTTNGKCSSDDEECGANGGGSDDRDDKAESPPNSKLKARWQSASRARTANKPRARNRPPPEVSYTRCSDCRQVLDAAELRLFEGDPANAVDEFSALTDPRLSVFNDSGAVDDGGDDVMDTPQHKLTQFTVYDRHTHLCPIDAGLIERDVELYFSGYVKPIYDEDPSPENGICCKAMGPIGAWWTAGFDGGENAVIGFTTPYADYVLMAPSEQYAPFIDAIKEKIYMSKLVIETLVKDPSTTYEDLLNKLELTPPPQGIAKFTEDALLRNAQFVVDQVQSFDVTGDDDEAHLIATPCLRSLVHLAGKPVGTLATTTPLVRDVFEVLFHGQIDDKASNTVRRKRCGVCEACQSADCGKCGACKDMVKFGGTGRQKQCCVERRCLNKVFQEAEEDDGDTEEMEDELDRKAAQAEAPSSTRKTARRGGSDVRWADDEPVAKLNKKSYYSRALVNGHELRWGDFVLVTPTDPGTPLDVARVVYMYETPSGEKMFHAHWFWRGSDTVLGESSDPRELFLVNECDNQSLSAVNDLCTVVHKPVAEDWFSRGGVHSLEDECVLQGEDDGRSFFYQKAYESEHARFVDPPELPCPEECDVTQACTSCRHAEAEEKLETPVPGDVVEEENGRICYSSIAFQGKSFCIGECVFLEPDAFEFDYKPAKSKNNKGSVKKEDVDEEMYPEYYRKRSEYIKGSNADVPEPFKIGKIVSIYKKSGSGNGKNEPEMFRLRVKKFYRSENTHQPKLGCRPVSLVLLRRRGCRRAEPAYESETKSFVEPSSKARMMGCLGKGKGKKGKSSTKTVAIEPPEEFYVPHRKLRSLDVFAGCGGLSEGFHQAGVSETCWAIEREEPAATAFRLNFPDATIFTDDCNRLLRLVMDGETVNERGQTLPQKGDVELLCGGPPCQGFSGMNRFNSRQYSQFKNSLIASYLSYCEYYRPRFFLLENVRNFVSFKRSMVLKLTLRCLISMGYQCTFGVLQAGNYGVPQTRRRAIILAAAPGEKLPLYPEPQHVFAPRACQLTVMVDERKYLSNCKWSSSAPLRTITVRDAMSDLPEIRNGAKFNEIPYGAQALTPFQKVLRAGGAVLRDHVCKEMAPLVEARMRHIPLGPGSDWRDLPNIVVRLSDGVTYTKKLRYTHHDPKNGKSSTGALRGVCPVRVGQAVRPGVPPGQHPDSVVPAAHWQQAQPLGRSVRSTRVGRLLQHDRDQSRSRWASRGESCTPSSTEWHRQVGNAVPPPMARAIGREILKCLAAEGQDNSN